MRMQGKAWLLIAALAALCLTPASGANAQKYYSRGGIAARPSAPRHYGGGGGGGWYRGLVLGLPGIVLRAPPGGEVIDEGPAHPRRPHRRSARRRPSGAPPAGEHRYVPDEVVIEVANSLSAAQIDALQRRYRLVRIESYRVQLSNTTVLRWRIPDRRSVAAVVRSLERDDAVASAQPNYLFTLQHDQIKPASESMPGQYELAKLRLTQAHALAKGDNVRVAVIDSGIDVDNPELAGSIAASFDTLAAPMTPHAHGTAIAALIAAHDRLMGAAPEAKILAVRAFNPDAHGAQGTTFDILKGLDWAAAHHARVINMSFAGPYDPAMHRSLEATHEKGIVLVAAAGNGGAKSPPLYPAADRQVIAVTATTAEDKLFPQSNRGRYIAVAAPGAQIPVAIPGGYEISSGTSYSAAEVSGIVALMLQRAPDLSPALVRHILLATAKDLGPRGHDSLFGAGLADAYGAVLAEKPPLAAAQPDRHVTTGQR
jgi:subtilisin family serine protease